MPRVTKRSRKSRGPAGYLFWVLSDIHADAGDESFPGRCGKIARDFVDSMQRITEHFPDDVQAGLLLAGDLTHSSARADYDAFTSHILRPFSDALGDATPIFAVPGNHDHLRGAMPLDTRGTVGGRPDVSLHPKAVTDNYEREHLVAQTANWELRVGSRFFLFDQWSRAHTSVQSERTAGPWKTTIPRSGADPGFTLQLVGLNSAIASDGSGAETRLWLHDAQVRQVLSEPVDDVVTLTVLHHAPDRDLDDHDGEALAMLYERSTVILHGHYHERGGEPAVVGRPPILRAPALGHPRPAAGIDCNKRDGCAVLRILPKGVQMFFLSHRQPENNELMMVEYTKTVGGLPRPDCDLTYEPGAAIARVGA